MATDVGSQKTGVDPSAGRWGRRADGAQVQAYRRMDTLPAGRMSRGHFYFSILLQRCSPVGADDGPTPPAVATGTRQTRQCLRYSAEGSCPSGPSSGPRKTNRNFIDQQCAHAVPSLTGKVPQSLPQRSRDRPTALKFFLGSTISLRRQYSPEHIYGQPRFVRTRCPFKKFRHGATSG